MNWRLNVRESPPRPHFRSERRASIIGSDEDGIDATAAAAAAAAAQASSTYSSRPTHRRASILDPLIAAQQANAANANGNHLPENPQEAKEVQNARALQVLARVKEKLTGRDFKKPTHQDIGRSIIDSLQKAGVKSLKDGEKQVSLSQMTTTTLGSGDDGQELSVDWQVEKLLGQATSVENLCQHYIGWCSFW